MARTIEWEIPAELQPKPEDYAFDLDRALGAVLGLHATVPEDAFTAGTLGTERAGSGVLIRKDGLVLTIGYLITEAESLWLTSSVGGAVPGHEIGRASCRERVEMSLVGGSLKKNAKNGIHASIKADS